MYQKFKCQHLKIVFQLQNNLSLFTTHKFKRLFCTENWFKPLVLKMLCYTIFKPNLGLEYTLEFKINIVYPKNTEMTTQKSAVFN